MRALLPEPLDDVDVHAYYARDWLDTGGLRMNFVASVDGAAQTPGVGADAGLSGGLQTPGDNRIFGALRDLADVVVAGAGTVLAEGYGAVRLSDRRRGIRCDRGLAETLPTAVISRSLALDPGADLFAAAPPDARTVVLTCAAADPERRHALAAVADVVLCGDALVEPARARAALVERGYRRILCEGGPTVFAEFARDGAADELCLSVTPLLAGPGPNRITAGLAWPGTGGATLTGLLEEDGALFCRYRLSPPADVPRS